MPDLTAKTIIGAGPLLQLPDYHNFPYPEGAGCAWVHSGRAAFECLLRSMPRPSRVLVPRFACDTLLEPLHRLGIPVERYSVTEQLHPCPPANVNAGDLLVLINYFGLTDEVVRAAALRHPGPVVVDATTALYSAPQPGIPTFYSPRKFAGLSDGGIACAPFNVLLPAEEDLAAERMQALLQRAEQGPLAAASATEQAEASLSVPARRMAPLTRRLITATDWTSAARLRLGNYARLHAALAPINRLQLPEKPTTAPMCYPLVSGIPGLRDELIEAGILLPLYWPEVIAATPAEAVENRLARTLLPLPLDQSCTANDMERLIKLILS